MVGVGCANVHDLLKEFYELSEKIRPKFADNHGLDASISNQRPNTE